jgi:hypothetical protein
MLKQDDIVTKVFKRGKKCIYVMVTEVVEFSSRGTKLERFLPKNQHTQRKFLNFKNWCDGEVSKSAKI